jgi:glycosyltransferase involved in cell wall biosynthesis
MNDKFFNQNEIDITFCIPTFNRADIVYKCILHLLKISSHKIEVIVSDNASQDHTRELLSKIVDPRFSLQHLPLNTGTFNLLNAALNSRGRIFTWLSDEDDFEINSLDLILDSFSSDPTLSVLIGSTVFGVSQDLISFKNRKILHRRLSLLFLLNFSGCGGVFVRNVDFKRKIKNFHITPENCYEIWNYYPVGFLSAIALEGSLKTTQEIVCRQNRFGRTTIDWKPALELGEIKNKAAPHFWPSSIRDKISSKLRFVLDDKQLNLRDKFMMINHILHQAFSDFYSIRNPNFLVLLQQHYSIQEIIDFRSEIESSNFEFFFKVTTEILALYLYVAKYFFMKTKLDV